MQEIWQWVHSCYGNELGLTSDDDDYIAPSLLSKTLSDSKMSNKQSAESLSEVRFMYNIYSVNIQKTNI